MFIDLPAHSELGPNFSNFLLILNKSSNKIVPFIKIIYERILSKIIIKAKEFIDLISVFLGNHDNDYTSYAKIYADISENLLKFLITLINNSPLIIAESEAQSQGLFAFLIELIDKI